MIDKFFGYFNACSEGIYMGKLLKIVLFTACFAVPIVNANNTDVDKALDKTKTGAIELFEIAKEKGSEIGENLIEKGAELGDQANERAQESGAIFWENMKKIGSASKQFAEDGSEKLKEFACDLSDMACLDAAKKESETSLDDSI